MKKYVSAVLLLVCLPTCLRAVAPLIGDVPDQVIAQGTNTGALFFTIGDTETAFPALNVTASSNNPTLVPNNAANLALGGTTAQRTITVTPVAGQLGTTTITLTVQNGERLTASSTFSVTVTGPNTPPTIDGLPGYQIIDPGQTPASVSFVVNDAETAAGSLSVRATSSNTRLVPNTSIILVNNGANRTVQVTPIVGQRGASVIKLRVTDSLGASAQGEFVFSVFDASSANNGFKQPRGIYVLDSTAGTQIRGVSMRDGNIRDKPFVDGYVLRTEWATLEPADGAFDFTIITNIFAKLPARQKLSLLIGSGELPIWLNSLPGITTYTAGTPSATRPSPWDTLAQERYRRLLVALGNHVVDGAPLRQHPRLAAMNAWIPGLKSGIREPDEIRIRDLPGYTRTLMQNGVLRHLANVTDNFPDVPVQIGFWTYTDATASPAPWEVLRALILAQHDGINRPRVGFWMENLAANRPAAETDPWTGMPNLTYTAPLYLSQNATFVGYQVLGSWARPFNSAHVNNNLNGTPEDGMDYGFNDFQCRYFEHYQADVDFVGYAAEFQRWHDFLNALPARPNSSGQSGTIAVNLSARGPVTESEPLIAGFVLAGTGTHTLLVRAVGPTLTGFGVGGALPDPLLRLYAGNTVHSENDNWSTATNASAISATAARTGAFPLPAGGNDSALLVNLPAGTYTAHVLTKGSVGGTALIEVYDAGSGNDLRLVNLSVRASTSEATPLIVGFALAGSDARSVLVRAIGPTLAGLGVANTLANPSLRLYAGSNARAENDDWSTANNAVPLENYAALAGAFALPAGSKDAATLVSLSPAAYTAHVLGGTGTVLLEIYTP